MKQMKKRRRHRRAQEGMTQFKVIALLGGLALAVCMFLAVTTNASTVKFPVSGQGIKYMEQYNISQEFMFELEKYCDIYNTDLDLVIAIAEQRSKANIYASNEYGKGFMNMKPSTIQWVCEKTGTFPGEITKPQTAAKTSVYFIDHKLGHHKNIVDTIEDICGNETDTVKEVGDIYFRNTSRRLY